MKPIIDSTAPAQPTITNLPQQIAALPPELRSIADTLFAVATSHGQLIMPASMHEWATRLFGDLATVEQQTAIAITNRLTLEAALFNPLRARRPSANGQTDETALEAWIQDELRDDIFAKPLASTPEDRFGRIQGQWCQTASNIAKYDGWHGVVIFNEPHPLRFNHDHVLDYVDTAWRWIQAAHASDPQAIYPFISWNCLPKSGSSLIHGHMQVALAQHMPYARIESWRRAAVMYAQSGKRDYFADLGVLHTALGLALPELSGVQRFAHLTPLRNREIVLVDTAHRPDSAVRLAGAIAATLRTLIDEQGVRAFNVALAFPPLADDGQDWAGLRPYARIGDRGNPLTNRNDVGVMELYGSSVITIDPFEVVR